MLGGPRGRAGQSGTDQQISAATALLHDPTRALYRLLADEPTDS